jgi:hypothetical protein
MGVVIGLVWIVGIFVAVGVGRARIGMSQWGRLGLETVMRSLPWFLTSLVIMMFWPIALIVWLARGRAETPWELEETPRNGTLVVKRRH